MKIGDQLECVEDALNLTVGKVYTVVNYKLDSKFPIEVRNDEGDVSGYYSYRFKNVQPPTMEEQVKLAKSYLGKRVCYNTTHYDATMVKVFVDRATLTSMLVREEFEKSGFVVAVCNETKDIPVGLIKIAPNEFKLNDNYTAKIYADRVEVGCQTFSRELLENFFEVLNESKV